MQANELLAVARAVPPANHISSHLLTVGARMLTIDRHLGGARSPVRVAARGHVTIEACQVSGFVQRTAANPARSGRKQR